MSARHVHVIGAGLAGLSAAVQLVDAGHRVTLHEATMHAGGRCRSYRDPVLKREIDNGNHLILSGNRGALAYLEAIGASDLVSGPEAALFHFFDLKSGQDWILDLGESRLPLWVFDAQKRVPGTHLIDYLAVAGLLLPKYGRTVGETIACSGPLYDRMMAPMLLACLNIAPPDGSAKLAAAVLWRTIAAGGRNCRPLIAHRGLAAAFVDPALTHLERNGVEIRFGEALRTLDFGGDRVEGLQFDDEHVVLGEDEAAIVAVPPEMAARLVPDLVTPNAFRAIANLHFLAESALPPMTGVLNGISQWIFNFPGRIAVTISAADDLLEQPREALAEAVWAEVAQIAKLPLDLPPWQVVRERRATFATTPEQETRRPESKTKWRNLFLAGDWTATGLPPTIESAVQSGERAATLATA